jgi:hypothetical protein
MRLSSSMPEIRGTLILCDNVYRTDQGKWIIAGTYNHWRTSNDELALPPLQTYIRLQCERPGTYPGRLIMVDRAQPPQALPMLEVGFEIAVSEGDTPMFETALLLPELRLKAPVPYAQRPPGSAIVLRTLLWLKVKDMDIASCHLDFHFHGPALGPLQPPVGGPPLA